MLYMKHPITCAPPSPFPQLPGPLTRLHTLLGTFLYGGAQIAGEDLATSSQLYTQLAILSRMRKEKSLCTAGKYKVRNPHL